MKSMRRINLYITSIILLTVIRTNANPIISSINDNGKTKFKVEVKNSIGEPQTKIFLKITGRSEVYKVDSCGIINFEYEIPKNYKRTANIYLNEDTKNPEKTFTLDEENTVLNFCIDTKEDILRFKQENSTFNIEGIVTTEDGEPITGATVSIQGTGRYATTDEIGLFSIDADFNHYIIIRADGMENLSMTVSPFGVVVMQFVVEKNGDITSPKVVRRLEASLDSVAMNLIKGMPRWTPASDHGVKVRCKYSVPIAFKIPVPKPVVIENNPIKEIAGDSLITLNDSTILRPDTLIQDSILSDSIIKNKLLNDSTIIENDSIRNDSIISTKLTGKEDTATGNTTKVKKRNAFVRFFRWLFGIKDKEEKKNEEIKENKEIKELPEQNSTEIENKDKIEIEQKEEL